MIDLMRSEQGYVQCDWEDNILPTRKLEEDSEVIRE